METMKDQKASGRPEVPSRERLILRILLTAAGVGIVAYLAFHSLPAPRPRLDSWQSKLMYTLRWQIFSLFTLLMGVWFVALTRLFTPAVNPLDPRAEAYVGTYTRCLQNTLEQLVLSVPAQLILSSFLESESMRIIPVLVAFFVVGRIAFWVGYPSNRAYGFVMTFSPTVVTYVVDIFFFVTAGPSFRLTGH